jgi:hypothetical protein
MLPVTMGRFSRDLLWFEVVHFLIGGFATLFFPSVVLSSYLPLIPQSEALLQLVQLLTPFYLATALLFFFRISSCSAIHEHHFVLSLFYASCFALDLFHPAAAASRPGIVAFHLVMAIVHGLSN